MIASTSPNRAQTTDWTSRLNLLVGLALLCAGLISWRLFTKSVIEHPLYAAKAENQYEVSKELPSRRGTIYAADFETGRPVPIAATEERFDVSVVPRNVTDEAAVLGVFVDLFGINPDDIRDVLNSDALYAPPIVRGVSKAERDQVLARAFDGLLIEKRHQRSYPERQTAAQVLGFVNREGTGNYGVEGYYDDELRGEAGSVIGQKDTLGRLIDTITQVDPTDGTDLELTIDHNAQFALEDRLYRGVSETGAQSGQVLLMDPNTGEILAMAGTPSFDPNKYSELPSDQQSRFANPLTSSTYEPGSIMKPITMATAINLGRLEPDTKQTFGKSVVIQGYEINTALDKAYGEETMTQVLENSDNVGMVWVSQQMNAEEQRAGLERFGFTETSGIDLQGDAQGRVPPVTDWAPITQATIAFGQGVSVTPLQIARAWSAIINGGRLVTPHVVKRLVGESGVTVEADAPIKEGVISPETSQKLRGMLQSVIDHGPYGRTRVPGYAIGGKTGTAQIASPDGGYLEDTFNHTLIGFFPADQPAYLLLVKLDRPSGGRFAEGTAGPIFHDMAKYLFSYYRLPPNVPASD